MAAFALSRPLAGTAGPHKGIYYAEDGLALDGYDPVAYFTRGRAVRGSPAYAVMWKGAIWQFASNRNRDLFEANPYAFAPQYGGFCAYGVAMGMAIASDPTAWQIVDGRLYLTHSHIVQRVWKMDTKHLIQTADSHWPAVLHR